MSKLLNSVDKVIINLPSRKDRRLGLLEEFKKHKIENFRWFDAKQKSDSGCVLGTGSPVEKAVAASHCMAAISSPYPKIVMEDDIRFTYLHHYERFFSSIDELLFSAPSDLDVLQMDLVIEHYTYYRRRTKSNLFLPWQIGMWSSAMNYYSESGIEKIRSWSKDNK